MVIPAMETPGIVALHGELYVLGGSNLSECSSVVQIYDPQIDEWRLGNPMSAARCYPAAAVFNGSAYVIGGFNNEWDQTVDSNEQLILPRP